MSLLGFVVALIKTFLEISEPQLRPLSVDDQIDGSIVRGLEQSGFLAVCIPLDKLRNIRLW